MASLLPTGGVFVDLGCGKGTVLDEIASLYESAIGLDFFTTRLSQRDSPPNTWLFVTTNLNQDIPLSNEAVTSVYSNQVIEHLLDPRSFAREVHRVLRPGGRALITTPNVRYLPHIFRLAWHGRGPKTANDDTTDGLWDDGHLHYFTHRDLHDVFSSCGFSLVYSQALINLSGGQPTIRKLLDEFAHTTPVREFLSGNILFLLEK